MHPIILHVIPLSDFFIIFVKIILFTVKLAPYHPSTHCSKWFFRIDFFQNRCFRQSLVEVFGPSYALCHYTQRVFVIFAKVVVFVVCLIFIAVSLLCNQHFLFSVIFVKMVFFVAFVGVFRPSRASCHCTQQFFLVIFVETVIFAKIVVFVLFIGFLKLNPPMSYAIALNKFFVVFLEIVIFVSFVDYLRLFVIFCNFCNCMYNPGEKSLYTSQVTLSIFPNICLLVISVQLTPSDQSLGFNLLRENVHTTCHVLTGFNNWPIINSYSSRTRRIWADIYNQRGRRPSWLLSAHIRQVREE